MTISLENEVVVVTGGAKRLGRAIASGCAASGASVAITYNHSRDEATNLISQLQSRYPDGKFAAFPCELSQTDQIMQLRVAILQYFGTVTALVNNAAIFRRTPFEETSSLDWERSFDEHIAANLKAPYLLCKQFGEIFLAQGRGSIVNISDIYGLRPLKNYAPYCISKAGVVMLTEVLAKALAPSVRVNCLCPGTILVPSQTQGEGEDVELLVRNVPVGRLGTPEEIAAAVTFLLAGPTFLTGVILPLDGAQRLK